MYQETTANDLRLLLQEQLEFCETVLDIGSGTGVLLEDYPAAAVIALDIHRPYLVHRVYRAPHIIPLHADAREIGKLFLPGTFSAVTFIDSLEHLNREDGKVLLAKAEEIASRKVIVFTPRGFFPQSGVDYYALNGEQYQQHLSGWEPEDLSSLGYEVLILKGFHHSGNLAFQRAFGDGHPPLDALLAWKTVRQAAAGKGG